ncbi:hypothetical protein Sste5346_009917 [Sporothrix stenoceras]|uniref:Uncharacterized protein n=1 Tax=Sporothrix stenoceras TaxID=5173 RepID=A0ABR3YIA3_9PEZI
MSSSDTRDSVATVSENPQPNMLFTTVPAVFARLAVLERHQDQDQQDHQDALTIGQISPSEFRALVTARDRRRPKLRLFYEPASACAVITVPSTPHNKMHFGLYKQILYSIRDMGLDDEWTTCLDDTFYGEDGSSGQADSGGSPIAHWGGGTGNNWPTLVIEAGVTQMFPSLRAKMVWWFAASSHRVKIVILMKLQLGQEAIDIEQWTETLTTRQGAMTRSMARAGQSSGLQPDCRQTISITWAGPQAVLSIPSQDRTPQHFRVSGGPLVINFEDLFLRPPDVSHGERDLVVPDDTLQDVATMVWRFV